MPENTTFGRVPSSPFDDELLLVLSPPFLSGGAPAVLHHRFRQCAAALCGHAVAGTEVTAAAETAWWWDWWTGRGHSCGEQAVAAATRRRLMALHVRWQSSATAVTSVFECCRKAVECEYNSVVYRRVASGCAVVSAGAEWADAAKSTWPRCQEHPSFATAVLYPPLAWILVQPRDPDRAPGTKIYSNMSNLASFFGFNFDLHHQFFQRDAGWCSCYGGRSSHRQRRCHRVEAHALPSR
jgi:hypothetical protein